MLPPPVSCRTPGCPFPTPSAPDGHKREGACYSPLVEKKFSGNLSSLPGLVPPLSVLCFSVSESAVGYNPTHFALVDIAASGWFDHPRRIAIIPVFSIVSRPSRLIGPGGYQSLSRCPVLLKGEGGHSSPLSWFSATLNYAQDFADGLSDMGYRQEPLQAQNPIFSPNVLCLI
jgi:hypothetical protein